MTKTLNTLLLTTALATLASGQNTTTNVFLQQAVLSGSGNTISANWIPLQLPGGSVVYANLTIQFDADASGNLTVTANFPQQQPAPQPLVSSFVAGRYVSPANILNGKGFILLSGPGLTVGGVTAWSLAAAPNADPSTFPASANWYTGPIDSNPYAARLKKAGITSPFMSYGTMGSRNYNNSWLANGLIGVSQVGNTVTISSFTDYGGGDHATPVDQITYTLAPAPAQN